MQGEDDVVDGPGRAEPQPDPDGPDGQVGAVGVAQQQRRPRGRTSRKTPTSERAAGAGSTPAAVNAIPKAAGAAALVSTVRIQVPSATERAAVTAGCASATFSASPSRPSKAARASRLTSPCGPGAAGLASAVTCSRLSGTGTGRARLTGECTSCSIRSVSSVDVTPGTPPSGSPANPWPRYSSSSSGPGAVTSSSTRTCRALRSLRFVTLARSRPRAVPPGPRPGGLRRLDPEGERDVVLPLDPEDSQQGQRLGQPGKCIWTARTSSVSCNRSSLVIPCRVVSQRLEPSPLGSTLTPVRSASRGRSPRSGWPAARGSRQDSS